MSTDGPHSLRWWMEERRGELGLTQQQLADIAGVSTETIYRAADGRAMRTTTRKGIERALQWQSGSVNAILRGDDPRPLPVADGTADAEISRPQIDPVAGTLTDWRRAIEYFNHRFRETPGDIILLNDLLALNTRLDLERSRASTVSGEGADA